MDKITNFYYDMFIMWYEYDPSDGGLDAPYYCIQDYEARYMALAIDTLSEDLSRYIDMLYEFGQQQVEDEDDEYIERTEKIINTYSDLIERRLDSVSHDDLIKREQIAKRHKFLYDYYFLSLDYATDLEWELENLEYDVSDYEPERLDRLDIESVAAECANRDALSFDSGDYTGRVLDCVERIEELFEDSASYADGDCTHACATELMNIFTKHYGDNLWVKDLVMVEDSWCIYVCVQDEHPDRFDHYDFGTLSGK